MTDQDKIPRFADGEPVLPLSERRRDPVLFSAVVLLAVLTAFYLLFVEMPAWLVPDAFADEGPAPIALFERPGECSISATLRVSGNKRAACVEHLETAARLARAEMVVNERPRRSTTTRPPGAPHRSP